MTKEEKIQQIEQLRQDLAALPDKEAVAIEENTQIIKNQFAVHKADLEDQINRLTDQLEE